MNDDERKELERLRAEVQLLRQQNKKLEEACETILTRNLMLSDHMDAYYEVRRRVEWLKELVRKHRELMQQADLRDDSELLAVIETRLEIDNIPLPPEFGLKDVAELVGTTQSRIVELYKKNTIYHSVDNYLNFLRLTRALRLLHEQKGYSIEAIASEAGFNTVRTLNRKIQEAIGMTPRQFRDLAMIEE